MVDLNEGVKGDELSFTIQGYFKNIIKKGLISRSIEVSIAAGIIKFREVINLLDGYKSTFGIIKYLALQEVVYTKTKDSL